MSSQSTSHGLALQYSGQAGKCCSCVRLVQQISWAILNLTWLVEGAIVTAKFRNKWVPQCLSLKWNPKGWSVLALRQIVGSVNFSQCSYAHARAEKHLTFESGFIAFCCLLWMGVFLCIGLVWWCGGALLLLLLVFCLFVLGGYSIGMKNIMAK